MKIAFLVPYPLHESPSQRFRFEQYFSILSAKGHSYQIQSFLNSSDWKLFSTSGNNIARALALLKGFIKRFIILFRISTFDFVFIHREATPIGPPFIEWIIAKLFRKKIIYDFDDAIWLTDRNQESLLFRLSKWRSKVKSICRWSHTISCGNNYLATYARQFNTNVFYNPTTIDTEALHNPELYEKKTEGYVTIGWTGSYSTIKYLHQLENAFQQIERKFPSVKFLFIADKAVALNLKNAKSIPWTSESEIFDLGKIDIGVMPLPDDDWSKGKCGFKALQFMALNIPVVASPVGVNGSIIDHGTNGLLASSNEEWVRSLTRLIEDADLRIFLGRNGRSTVNQFYSVKSNADNFMKLFAP